MNSILLFGFQSPDYGANFHQNRARIATVGGWTDRQMLVSLSYYAIAMGQIITEYKFALAAAQLL